MCQCLIQISAVELEKPGGRFGGHRAGHRRRAPIRSVPADSLQGFAVNATVAYDGSGHGLCVTGNVHPGRAQSQIRRWGVATGVLFYMIYQGRWQGDCPRGRLTNDSSAFLFDVIGYDPAAILEDNNVG
jgi:hypothetical protein